MRYYFKFILITIAIIDSLAQTQTCTVCGSVTLNGSSYPSGLNYFWSCSDGQTSTLQSPTLSVNQDMTCILVVTDPISGCVGQSSVFVDNCECNNDPCIAMNYNSSTECISFTYPGTNQQTPLTDVKEWKNQNTTFATIPVSNQICGCDLREYVDATPSCEVNGTDFRLRIDGLLNKCAGCTGSNMRIDFTFPIDGNNIVTFPSCGQDAEWVSITSSAFQAAGSVCNAYLRYTTPFGIVVNHYRYTYNNGGLTCSNMSVTTVVEKRIYKKITAKRTVTYAACPTKTCELTLDIPQNPNDPCTHFFTYINNVNLSSPCSGVGLSAVVLNASGTVTYQWKLNGANISGATTSTFCLVGQPTGAYSVEITDSGSGCVDETSVIVQASCSMAVNITQSTTILTANLVNCVGTASYQWAKWNGSSWTNVGTNNYTYNTTGNSGDYRCTVVCSGPPACSSIGYYTYTPPCTADVTITTGTSTLTGNVEGCSGANITYTWERQTGASTWAVVQSTTATSTSNVYTPTLAGTYRLTIVCGSCSDQAQTTWTPPNPCAGFSHVITGSFTGLCVGSNYTYNRTITGGTGPFSHVWKLNNATVGTSSTYTFTPSLAGTNILTLTVTDANNCSYTDTKTLSSSVCCTLSSGSLTSASVCQNQNATFTAVPSGGTAPYSYAWTSQLAPASPISQGSGNPKVLNFSATGTYVIGLTVTDNVGCTSATSTTMTVTNCANCDCTPSLILSGCQLNATFSGTGCANYTYQLQYSATGSGWTPLQTGTPANFNWTPTANGFYRVVMTSSSCSPKETPNVSVNCYSPTCSNAPTVTIAGSASQCGYGPTTLTGTFGGSATQVTFSENGTGSLSQTTVTSSPFSITYTPTNSDVNVAVTATTNNPLGSPCTPASAIHNITYTANPTPTITSSNANICVGDSRTLTGTPGGGTFAVVSGPATIAGNTITSTGIGSIIVSYSVTSGSCSGSIQQTITSVSCPCNGISMTISTLPGRISFGTLNYNGNPMTNYRIEWRRCSDNSVVFQSGMGTGAGSGVYSHPQSNIPVIQGCYYAQIITSDQGNNLNCFSQLNVVNWNCPSPPSYSYNGPGGAAATREFAMDITASTTHIKIGLFAPLTVPDLLEIIYNGVTLYSSSVNISSTDALFIPITYTASDPDVLFRITNQTPAQNTIWQIGQISCCSGLQSCPTLADVPSVTGATATINGQCNCAITPIRGTFDNTCRDCNLNGNPTYGLGGCSASTQSNNTCIGDGSILITKPNNTTRIIDFSVLTMYSTYKSYVQSLSNPDVRVFTEFRDVACGNDGISSQIFYFPNKSTITWDDVNYIMTIVVNTSNPYTNNCNGTCTGAYYNAYNSTINSFAGNAIVGTWQSITNRQNNTYNQVTPNQNTPFVSSVICDTYPCSTTLEKKYNIYLRNTSCPCQSWQLFFDSDNNVSYETLISEASGWTGTCQ